jgi:tetratricopeptide (TPR) repeat protein
VEGIYSIRGEPWLHVWDAVESLLDKSLLRSAEHEGEGRLRLLETIREYGLERLEASGEAEIIRRAHAEYFLRLGEEAEPLLKGAQQDDLTQAIVYNRESLTLARELGDKLLIALALNNLGYFTVLQGDLTLTIYAQEGFTLMRELGDRMYIIKTLHSVGYVTARQGNLAQAKTWYREGLTLAQEIRSEIDR